MSEFGSGDSRFESWSDNITIIYLYLFTMRKNIHPTSYKYVVFSDVNNDFQVLTRSTVTTDKEGKTIEWKDGKTYPLLERQISSASHNFYTGAKVDVDELGTIAKFNKKYGKK